MSVGVLVPVRAILAAVTFVAVFWAGMEAAAAKVSWQRIGSQQIDAASGIAGIAVAESAKGTSVRLQAQRGKVEMRAVVVTFGSGRAQVEERTIVLNQGERTRPIRLSDKDEPIHAVEIVLAPGQSGKATLEVWAESDAAEAPARPTPASAQPGLTRDPASGEWTIGEIKLGQLGFERKVVVAPDNPGFKTIMLEAKNEAVVVEAVDVAYKDGSQDRVPFPAGIEAGQRQKIAVPQPKPVSSIAVRSRSKVLGKRAKGAGVPTVAITGVAVEIEPSLVETAAQRQRDASRPEKATKRSTGKMVRRYSYTRPSGGTRGLGGSGAAGGSAMGSGGTGGPRLNREPAGATPPAVTPASYTEKLGSLDACVGDKSCTPVPIFFGTDRKQTELQGRISFGPDRAGRLQLGRVFVTVPSKNRAKGELNVPGWTDWVRGTPEGGDPKRHFTIPKSGVTLYASEAELIAAVREHIASGLGTHKDHAYVYVHGYRVPWEFAAMRTAQIAYDLSPDDAPFGTPFLYSWPSRGATADYVTDLEISRLAVPHLVKFLRMVVEKTGASNVHVIAHSMGNIPLVNALAEIARTTPDVKFSEVILAAPDVEREEFGTLAQDVVKAARGVTLYASSSDIALLFSRLVRSDRPRAGDAKEPPGPTVVEGIDTVDISRLSTGFMSYFSWNHDKYADSPVLLNDISLLFRTGQLGTERRLKPNERNVSFRLLQTAPPVAAGFWRYQE